MASARRAAAIVIGRNPTMSPTFADRLNHLFDALHPPGRGPHTSTEVTRALRAQGITMSAPYLSQLRTGARVRPSAEAKAALAWFFRIDPAYFTDDDYRQRVDDELGLRARVGNENALQRIVVGLAGLSPAAQQEILDHTERLRRHQHLDG
jgi:hypothetical protein